MGYSGIHCATLGYSGLLWATLGYSTNYVVKFGRRRETMKEIIAADPMKEVLHLRAYLVQGGKP